MHDDGSTGKGKCRRRTHVGQHVAETIDVCEVCHRSHRCEPDADEEKDSPALRKVSRHKNSSANAEFVVRKAYFVLDVIEPVHEREDSACKEDERKHAQPKQLRRMVLSEAVVDDSAFRGAHQPEREDQNCDRD